MAEEIPFDRFVLKRLEQEDRKPSPEASRETLIRRVTLDLTGLPPTPEQVSAFLADKSPDAYEKVVQRLLDSPAYGQRMAWPWLDAARYADTDGFQGDPHPDHVALAGLVGWCQQQHAVRSIHGRNAGR